MNERRKTFGTDPGSADDLGAGVFQPRPIARPDPDAARRVAREGGYASDAQQLSSIAQRRHRTGRTSQLNIKVTADHKARFTALADSMNVSLSVTFERALKALEQSMRGES